MEDSGLYVICSNASECDLNRECFHYKPHIHDSGCDDSYCPFFKNTPMKCVVFENEFIKSDEMEI